MLERIKSLIPIISFAIPVVTFGINFYNRVTVLETKVAQHVADYTELEGKHKELSGKYDKTKDEVLYLRIKMAEVTKTQMSQMQGIIQ